MSDNPDTPKLWESQEELELNQQTQDLTIVEEPSVPTLPVEERLAIIEQEASDNDKGILNALVEVSKTAEVLKKIDNEELQDGRNRVLKAWYDAFIQSKMQNSHTIEKVISKLADKLLNNIDNLDLEQAGILIEKFSNINAIMAQRNFADPSIGMPTGASQPAVSLTINNATAEGASINNPSVNIGSQPQVKNLSDLSNLNSAMKGWNGAPKKVKTTEAVDTEYKESK